MTSENSDRPRVLKLEGDHRASDTCRLYESEGVRTHPTPGVTGPGVALAGLEGPLAAAGRRGMAEDAPGPQRPRAATLAPVVFNQPRMPVVFHQPRMPVVFQQPRVVEPFMGIILAYEFESESCACCGDLYPEECACQIGECFDDCLFDDDDEASEDDEEDW